MTAETRPAVLERREFALAAIGNPQFDRGWLTGRFDRIIFAITFSALTYYSNQIGQQYHSYWLVAGAGSAIIIATFASLKCLELAKIQEYPDDCEQSAQGEVNKYLSVVLLSTLLIGLAYVIYAGYRDAATGKDYTLAGWSGAIYAGAASEILSRIISRIGRRKEIQP